MQVTLLLNAMCGGFPWSGGGVGGIYAEVYGADGMDSTSIVVSNVTVTNNTGGCSAYTQSFVRSESFRVGCCDLAGWVWCLWRSINCCRRGTSPRSEVLLVCCCTPGMQCMHACDGLVCGESSVMSLVDPCEGLIGGGIHASIYSGYGVTSGTSIVVTNVTAMENTAGGCTAYIRGESCDSYTCFVLLASLVGLVSWRPIECRHHHACVRRGGVGVLEIVPHVCTVQCMHTCQCVAVLCAVSLL